MEIPNDVLNKLQDESIKLDKSFSKVWMLLPASMERDSIMYNIISAKKQLNEFIIKHSTKE